MPTVPLSEAKTHLAKLLADVEALGEEVVITRAGRPVGVLLSLSDYEGLIDPTGLGGRAGGQAAAARGRVG